MKPCEELGEVAGRSSWLAFGSEPPVMRAGNIRGMENSTDMDGLLLKHQLRPPFAG